MAEPTLPALEFPPIKRSALLRHLCQDPDPPVDSLDDIRDYIELYRDKEDQKFVLQKHQQATEVHTMMSQFSSNAHRAIFDRRCSSTVQSRRDRLSRTESDRADLSETSQENRKGFATAAQQRWDSMKQRHLQELVKHDKKKPVRDVTSRFRKRSPDLLNLMIMERRLGFQARFEEVKAIRAEIDKLEAAEVESQSQAAIAEWEQQLRAIEDRHRREEEVMRHWIATREQECDKDRDVQLDAISKRSKFLNTEIQEMRGFSRGAGRHAVRRKCGFERSPSRGMVETTPVQEQIDKLAAALPERARQELLKCRY
jgi:hypothetical protein